MSNRKFPLFINLQGKAALIYGGGTVASRRAQVLQEFGAAVTVIAPQVDPALEGCGVVVCKEIYRPGFMPRAFLVVAATDSPAVNAAITQEARAIGAWSNNASNSGDCDFFFPAVALADEITVGITGNGHNHAAVRDAARQIREVLL